MNSVIENIKSRRSVRVYSDRKIERETLNEILDAGRWAPSAVNEQPWRFVVAESDSFRKKLAAFALPYYIKWIAGMPSEVAKRITDRNADMPDPVYYGAAAIVFVIGKGMAADMGCSMACQNIMLAARSMDIGSCWVYTGSLVVAEKEMKDALELKEGEQIYGPIILGYPKSGFPPPTERKALQVKWL